MRLSAMKVAVVLMTYVISVSQGQSTTSGCQNPADVVAVVDGSGSVGAANFQRLKTLLNNFVDSLAIGQSQTRLAVVVYASRVRTTIPFSGNAASLKSQIDALNFTGGGTNTSGGITKMTSLFTAHGRMGVAKIGIVFTDGRSSNFRATETAAWSGRAAGVNMFAVGIGSNVRVTELLAIASSTGQVIQVSDFRQLLTEVNSIIHSVCTAADTKCTSLLDVVVVMDGSGSISSRQFRQMQDALLRLLTHLHVTSDDTHLGLIVYSSTVSNRMELTGDVVTLARWVDRVRQPKASTATHLALQALTDMVRTSGRRGVAKVGVVLTDGVSSSPNSTAWRAKEARDAGVNMFAVGIGSGANQQELEAIASSRDQVVNVQDFDDLMNATGGLVADVCSSSSACSSPLELMAIVDGSGSIDSDDFRLMQDALLRLVDTLNVSPDKIRLGLVGFSSTIFETVPLSANPAQLKMNIRSMLQPSGGTNTYLAIDQMVSMLRDQGREGVSRVALVFTDGVSSNRDRTALEARKAREAGVNMFAVGVGNGINLAELKAIASAPDQVLEVENFKSLSGSVQNLVNYVCITEGLCDGCKMENGAGYNSHPADCTRYVQCRVDADGKVVAVPRSCSPGLFWDQDKLTCNYPSVTKCASDQCQKGGVSFYTFPGHCQDYWACEQAGAQRRTCPPGTAVSANFTCLPSDSCGAAVSATTTTTTTTPASTGCQKQVVPGKPAAYKQLVPGHGLMERPCPGGTVFNHDQCRCVTASSPPRACRPELYLPFNNGVSDASGRWTWVQNNGVAIAGGVATFDGAQSLRVPRFTNFAYGKDFVVKFRYLERNRTSTQSQALVTNADCGQTASFYVIRTSSTSVTFGYVNSAGETTSFTVNAYNDGWRDVEFRLSNGLLTGTVDRAVRSKAGTGTIARNHCALQFGRGFGYDNFVGQMDEVKVYLCSP